MSLKALLPLLLALLPLEPAAAAQPEPGRWREHSLSFTYSGFTTKYSCDGLADKVRGLLRALGARGDLRVANYGCAAVAGGPTEFPSVKLKFATLEPAGSPAASPAESPVALKEGMVPGEWRVVRLDRDRPRVLESGDCELLEQLRDRVLPLFSLRAVEDRTRCIPYQLSGTSLSLAFEVFAPARAPEPAQPANL